MRKSIITGVALLTMFASVGIARAEDKEIKGVLIDQKCAAGKDEEGAASHKKACTLKCADKAGFAVISGKKMLKLDDASATKAKEYFEKNESTKVVVKGEEKDGTLTVSSIEPQK
jgi:hypothetical protein